MFSLVGSGGLPALMTAVSADLDDRMAGWMDCSEMKLQLPLELHMPARLTVISAIAMWSPLTGRRRYGTYLPW